MPLDRVTIPCRADGVQVIGPNGETIATCRQAKPLNTTIARANAKLFAVAADHALLASLIISGIARWELFPGRRDYGQVCVNGLRYSTQLDEFGVPIIHEVLRTALITAWRPS